MDGVVQHQDLEDAEQLRVRVVPGERHVAVIGRNPGYEAQNA
jgi:hypothetical protein